MLAFTGEAEPKQHGGQLGRGGQFQNRTAKKKEAAPIKFKRGADAEESAAPVKESADLKNIRKRSRKHMRKDFESDEEGEYASYGEED